MNILLTGASRGIGKAAADALTAAGHHVIGDQNVEVVLPSEQAEGGQVRWSQRR